MSDQPWTRASPQPSAGLISGGGAARVLEIMRTETRVAMPCGVRSVAELNPNFIRRASQAAACRLRGRLACCACGQSDTIMKLCSRSDGEPLAGATGIADKVPLPKFCIIEWTAMRWGRRLVGGTLALLLGSSPLALMGSARELRSLLFQIECPPCSPSVSTLLRAD